MFAVKCGSGSQAPPLHHEALRELVAYRLLSLLAFLRSPLPLGWSVGIGRESSYRQIVPHRTHQVGTKSSIQDLQRLILRQTTYNQSMFEICNTMKSGVR